MGMQRESRGSRYKTFGIRCPLLGGRKAPSALKDLKRDNLSILNLERQLIPWEQTKGAITINPKGITDTV
jgi:hypothetical protein